MVELVTDYLEDTLPGPERARFEAHIAGCDGCTAYLEQMRATIALTGRLTEDEIPPEALAALLREFRDWREGPA
jgi:anti-sigma factor RsiW